MGRKSVTFFTLAAFVLFSASCTMWSTKDVKTMARHPHENAKVLSVVKTSGDDVRFAKSDPGRVRGDAVLGAAFDLTPRKVEIEGPFSMIKLNDRGKIYEVVDRNGQLHSVRQVLKEEPNRLTALVVDLKSQWVSIPLSDVRLIQIRKANTIMTVLAVLGIISVGSVLWIAHEMRKD